MQEQITHPGLTDDVAENPAQSAEYLNRLLADGEPADLLVALRQIAKARGGVSTLARKSELNPTQLYRTLSPQGNPELRSLSALLRAMGLRLAVQPANDEHAPA